MIGKAVPRMESNRKDGQRKEEQRTGSYREEGVREDSLREDSLREERAVRGVGKSTREKNEAENGALERKKALRRAPFLA